MSEASCTVEGRRVDVHSGVTYRTPGWTRESYLAGDELRFRRRFSPGRITFSATDQTHFSAADFAAMESATVVLHFANGKIVVGSGMGEVSERGPVASDDGSLKIALEGASVIEIPAEPQRPSTEIT